MGVLTKSLEYVIITTETKTNNPICMKATTMSAAKVHPMLVFWMGLLTGALVVGFMFLYGMMRTQEYQTASILYKLTTPVTTEIGGGGGNKLIDAIGGGGGNKIVLP